MKKSVLVGTFVAGASVGFVSCGVLVANKVLTSDRHREGLAKVVSEKVDKWLFGEEKSEGRYERNPKVSYRRYYDQKYNAPIIFETRVDAEITLSRIDDFIVEYGSISVQDFYELCGVSGVGADSTYGWMSVDGMEVVKVRNGFEISLPNPKPIVEG